MNALNNKSILITGGTGSFGQKIVQTIMDQYKPKKIIVFSRDELKQYEMQKKFPLQNKSPIRYFIGDVRDVSRLNFAMKDVDIVIHAAALKQVTTAEYNPFEAVKTNILGAQNVIEATLNNHVKKVIALSTDKASSPINLYGATKLTSDKLFTSANNYKGKKDIKFSVIRYGNVMGSRGSVIPLFLEQEKTGTIKITDKNMTRFNITLQEGVDFVLNSISRMMGGEIFIPKLKSYKILDLKNAISKKAKVKYIGIRSGEKIHEELISITDSINTIEFKDYFVILPESIYINWDRKKFITQKIKLGAKMCTKNFVYNSNTNKNFLSIQELDKLIKTSL